MIDVAVLNAAGIPISGDNPLAALQAEVALEWINANTTLTVDVNDTQSIAALPACAKLFVVKYITVIQRTPGVTSQSIEGLSMSFDASNTADSSVWALARSLLGAYLKSQVKVFPARGRWA